jgi:hypothetical protein
LPNIGNSIAGIICNDGLIELVAAAPKLKSAFADPLAATVTSIGFSSGVWPSLQAMTVYLPGGTPLIS